MKNIHALARDVGRIKNELREMAYFMWLNAGKPHGRDLEFWCDAEREMFGYTTDEYWKAVDEKLDGAQSHFGDYNYRK